MIVTGANISKEPLRAKKYTVASVAMLKSILNSVADLNT